MDKRREANAQGPYRTVVEQITRGERGKLNRIKEGGGAQRRSLRPYKLTKFGLVVAESAVCKRARGGHVNSTMGAREKEGICLTLRLGYSSSAKTAADPRETVDAL